MRLLIIFSFLIVSAFQIQAQEIQWVSWEEALEKQKTEPKKIFLDMYTDWCGWCKKLDATTFKEAEVVNFLNENFYAVKFDAERRDTVVFEDRAFKYVPAGRRGYHELAYALLNGRLGYPAMVYLDEELARIMISPGYKNGDKMMLELEFANDELYKEMSFQAFMSSKSK